MYFCYNYFHICQFHLTSQNNRSRYVKIRLQFWFQYSISIRTVTFKISTFSRVRPFRCQKCPSSKTSSLPTIVQLNEKQEFSNSAWRLFQQLLQTLLLNCFQQNYLPRFQISGLLVTIAIAVRCAFHSLVVTGMAGSCCGGRL